MRIFIFFDLPVTTAPRRRAAARFRRFLLNDGYNMLQYSVYVRTCHNIDDVEKHRSRIKQNLPHEGTIRMLVITEKQYQNAEILLGHLTEIDEPFQSEQLSIF